MSFSLTNWEITNQWTLCELSSLQIHHLLNINSFKSKKGTNNLLYYWMDKNGNFQLFEIYRI